MSEHLSKSAQGSGFVWLRAVLCGAGFTALCVFQGAGVNLLMFTLGWGLILLAITLRAPHQTVLALFAGPWAALLAVLAFVVLSIVFQASLSEDNSFVPTLGIALFPMGFVLALSLGRHVAAALLVIALVVLGFALRSTTVLLTGGGDDALAPFVDANIYAAICYLVLIPGFHVSLVRHWRGAPGRWPMLGAAMAAAFCLFAAIFGAQSRGAMLVMAGALVIWFALALWHRRSVLPVVALLATASGAYVSVEVLSARELGAEFETDLVSVGVSIRGALLSASLSMLDVRPWIGVGIFVFPLLYKRYRVEAEQETSGLYAHNDYLQLLVEAGVMGFALIAVVAIAICWRSLVVARRAPEDNVFGQLGPLMAVGAALAHALITFIVYSPPVALLLGLLCGCAYCRRDPDLEVFGAVRGQVWVKPASLLALVYGWLCFGYLGLDTYTASVFGGQQRLPFTDAIRADARATLGFARMAERLNADRGIPVFAQATFMAQRLEAEPDSAYLQEQTVATYRRAIATDPWNPLVLVRFSDLVASQPQLRGQLGRGEAVGDLLARALQIDPLFAPAIDRIVSALVDAGREREAMLLLKRQVMPWLDLMRGDHPEAAIRYFRLLDQWSARYGDDEIRAELSRLRNL